MSEWFDGWFLDWGFPAAIILTCVLLVVAVLGVSWWAWPKDSKGNPLPCTHYHSQTTYVYERIGNSMYPMPITSEVCDAWASPSPKVADHG